MAMFRKKEQRHYDINISALNHIATGNTPLCDQIFESVYNRIFAMKAHVTKGLTVYIRLSVMGTSIHQYYKTTCLQYANNYWKFAKEIFFELLYA